MATKPESPTEPFKRALAHAARSLAETPDLEVVFSGDGPSLVGNRATLPHPPRDLNPKEAARIRGMADQMALRLAHHDEAAKVVADCQAGAHRGQECVNAQAAVAAAKRDARMDEICDAAPQSGWTAFASKFAALLGIIVVILSIAILAGVITQAFHGYTRFQIGLYLQTILVIDFSLFFFLALLAFLIHAIVIGGMSIGNIRDLLDPEGAKARKEAVIAAAKAPPAAATQAPAAATPAADATAASPAKPDAEKSAVEKATTEVAKPGEIPKAPDDLGLSIEDTNPQ